MKRLLLLSLASLSIANAKADFVPSITHQEFTAKSVLSICFSEEDAMSLRTAAQDNDMDAFKSVFNNTSSAVLPEGTKFFLEAIGRGPDDGVCRIRLKGARRSGYTPNEIFMRASGLEPK
jgi:hypothetical protein